MNYNTDLQLWINLRESAARTRDFHPLAVIDGHVTNPKDGVIGRFPDHATAIQTLLEAGWIRQARNVMDATSPVFHACDNPPSPLRATAPRTRDRQADRQLLIDAYDAGARWVIAGPNFYHFFTTERAMKLRIGGWSDDVRPVHGALRAHHAENLSFYT